MDARDVCCIISHGSHPALLDVRQVQLLTLLGLLVFVLGLNLLMACILQASVAGRGSAADAHLEMEPLNSKRRRRRDRV